MVHSPTIPQVKGYILDRVNLELLYDKVTKGTKLNRLESIYTVMLSSDTTWQSVSTTQQSL